MNEHEAKTIDAFIVKEKRERYKFLLGNPKKRKAALDHLNHFYDLDEKYVTWLPSNASVEGMLRQEGSPEEVYVISDIQNIDGRLMPLGDAISETISGGWGTIISCIPGQLAYYHGEAGEGEAILKHKPSV